MCEIDGTVERVDDPSGGVIDEVVARTAGRVRFFADEFVVGVLLLDGGVDEFLDI